MEKRIVLPFSICLVALTFFSGCKPKKVEKTERIVPVEVQVAQPDSISSYIRITGGIEAQNDAIVYSKVSEKLISVHVKPGENVKAGQILAVQYNQGAVQGQLLAEASLKSAKIQLQSKADDFKRMQNLLAKNAITQQQYDLSKSQYDVALAAIDQATASLEQAKVQYENTILRAPFDGRVGAIYYDVNEMVPAGQQVVKIVNASNVKAKLRLPSNDIQKITIGQHVDAYFPSLPDLQFSGTVSRIDDAIDPLTRTFEIEVRLENKQHYLKSGMFGEFQIQTAMQAATVVISELTLMTRMELMTNDKGVQTERPDYYLYVIKAGKVEKRSVTPGIMSSGFIEIAKGVQFGDSIVVAGQNIVKVGDSVNVVSRKER